MSRTTRLMFANATVATWAACAVTWIVATAPLSAQTGEQMWSAPLSLSAGWKRYRC